MFFEEIKKVVSFNESINVDTILSEMTTMNYSNNNISFVKALQECYDQNNILQLSESAKDELLAEIVDMEIKLNALRETCQLNEGGLGFHINALTIKYQTGPNGVDPLIEKRVAKVLKGIKNEKDRETVIKALQKSKEAGQKIKNKSDVKIILERTLGFFALAMSAALLGNLVILCTSLINICLGIAVSTQAIDNKNSGKLDIYAKLVDALILDVKAYKIPE